MEIDMSQLEVVMEAFISGCTNYLQDMEAGLNVHALMLSFMGEYTYEHIIEQIDAGNEEIIAKRKQAKGLTFAGQYGAGIWKLSQQSGLPQEVVKRVFANFNARYPELSRCKEEITAHLLQNQVPMIGTPLAMWDKQEAPEGHCQHYAQWQSCFGSLYTFYDKGQYNRFKQFTRTYDRRQICNYPIQGSAAVLVGLLCGKVFRFLRKYEGYAKLRLEVHDSLLIDIKKEKQEEIVAGVVEIMNSGAKYIEEIFGIPCSAPFTATYKIGQTWKECK
jgi:DNA polymerase I-like protein with 3'-5' exonuclease and polymerase domains